MSNDEAVTESDLEFYRRAHQFNDEMTIDLMRRGTFTAEEIAKTEALLRRGRDTCEICHPEKYE